MRKGKNLDNFKTRYGVATGGTRMTYAAMPLKEYVDIWLTTFKQDSLKPASLARLRNSAATMGKYKISEMALKDITAFDLQVYVNQLTEDGYALTTIKKLLCIATAPLKHAAAMHFIFADPTVGVSLPRESRVKKPAKDTSPYTPAEQERLWKLIDASDIPAVLAIGFMLETGLRVGEMLALRWDRIDIRRKRMEVVATILNPTAAHSATYQESPKSKSSRRTVPLTPKALAILNKLQGNHDIWVFTGRDHERLSYKSLVDYTKRTCKNANVSYKGEHVFRHTFATNCYYRGVDVKVLSKLLGHSDVNVTYNIYISLRDDGFDEMYDALVG